MRKFPVSAVAVLLVVLAVGSVRAQAEQGSPASRDLDWTLQQSGWAGGDPALTSFAAAAAGGHALRFDAVGSGEVRLYHQTVMPTPAAASAPKPERFAMTLAGLGALGLVSRRRLRHT